MLWLQALADVVRLSSWTLAVAIGIAAAIQAVLFVWNTAADIGRQTFAIVTTGAARDQIIFNITQKLIIFNDEQTLFSFPNIYIFQIVKIKQIRQIKYYIDLIILETDIFSSI